ncbi:MAG: ABC transporter permease DevC [Pirellulaceae bacterium]
MKTPLAWRNLVHNKVRTAVATAGVTFAVVLIFMQTGFHGAVETTATLVYDALKFDVVLRSPEYLHISDPRSFPIERVRKAAESPAVETATPFYIESSLWKNPKNGRSRGILAIGVRPQDDVFKDAEIDDKQRRLVAPEMLLIDRKSRKEFGPQNDRRFGDEDKGVVAEVAGKRMRIVDHFQLGAGLANDGTILLSAEGFSRIAPHRTKRDVSLGLIVLKNPAQAAEVARQLSEILPPDVEVLTRDEIIALEKERWVYQTSIGLIFLLGVGISLLVGTAIVNQVLSNDVANHLAEYATLKAMGYTDMYLASVVLMQAVLLALFGFLPGIAISEVLYRVTSLLANIPIAMNAGRAMLVLGLTIAMCVLSGFIALRKVRSLDPADLF